MPRDGEKQASRIVAPEALPVAQVIKATGRKYTDELQFAFPDVVPPYVPLGTRILVQLRAPGGMKTLANGHKFYLPDETVDFEKMVVQTALVRSLGPAAFKSRGPTMQNWPEGDWCVPGEFVRIPRYGGDRVAVPLNDEQNRDVIFMTMEDKDVIGLIPTRHDPLSVKQVI